MEIVESVLLTYGYFFVGKLWELRTKSIIVLLKKCNYFFEKQTNEKTETSRNKASRTKV